MSIETLTFRKALLNPFTPLLTFWRHRSLIMRLAARDIESKYRGSLLGILWSLITPLMLLGVYTFVFSVVFQSRWAQTNTSGDRGSFAVILFASLIVYNLFAECVNRAPTLMLENVAYIKKVVFPLEVMPWVSLCTGLFGFGVAFFALICFYVSLMGLPSPMVLALPLVLLPLMIMTLGIVWFLASLGVYLRDIRQVVGVFTTMIMFLSPVFYPVSGVPESLRPYLFLNPIATILEDARNTLFFDIFPPWEHLVSLWLVAICSAWLGLAWFAKTKKGFADVT